MRLRKLKDSITAADDVEITAATNEEAFEELIQFLDDKSLALVMEPSSTSRNMVDCTISVSLTRMTLTLTLLTILVTRRVGMKS